MIRPAQKIVWVYPRVGGETEGRLTQERYYGGLSPRGRGNLPIPSPPSSPPGSIPAWAGKPEIDEWRASRERVYPRVGGETAAYRAASHPWSGLSPRGRGNHGLAVSVLDDQRSIPAWAGKPPTSASASSRRQVYPRVGGETVPIAMSRDQGCGLSPRGRGNPELLRARDNAKRSIPAWAGKPCGCSRGRSSPTVYPRVGGETSAGKRHFLLTGGLSPRGRGNPPVVALGRALRRSIPAWAGKPEWCRT